MTTPTPRFGEHAAAFAGLAARALGWRPGEFWASTPAELAGALGLAGADGGIGPLPVCDRATLKRMMEEQR